MTRYSALLAEAWLECDTIVDVCRPPVALSRLSARPTVLKWLIYLDKFLVFPPILIVKSFFADIVHVADHSDSLLLIPLRTRARKIVTVHDLIAVGAAIGRIPEHRPRALGRIYQRLVLRGLKCADELLAVSSATSQSIAEIAGRGSYVVRNPVDPNLSRTSAGYRVFGLDPYVLVVSSVGWRKRREFALEVWLKIRKSEALKDVKIAVVGDRMTSAEGIILADVSATDFVFLHNLSDGQLAGAYEGCTAVLQLSRYEGLGWPILEGNSYGKPALCSDVPVLRETAGRSGVFVGDNPLSETDWNSVADELLGLTESCEPADNLSRFQWENFVLGLDSVLDRHIDRKSLRRGE